MLFVAALLKHPHICLPLMKKNRTGYGARSQRTPSVSKAERFVWVSQVSQPSASPLLSCKLKRVLNAGMHVRKHTQNKRQQASLFDQPHGTTTSCSNKKQEKTTTSEGRQLKLPQASSKQKRETPKVKAWISPFLDASWCNSATDTCTPKPKMIGIWEAAEERIAKKNLKQSRM